jgi:hypothetical protein
MGMRDRARRGQFELLVIAIVVMSAAWPGVARAATWSLQSVPAPTVPTGTLSAVNCTSPSACTAVGSYINSSGIQVPLAERWNGSGWSIQSTPNPAGAGSSALAGVRCPTSTMCVAVGTSDGRPLVERWNGTGWSIQNVPAPSAGRLNAVTCTSSTACVAVGASGGTVVVERWNGTSWTVQTVPVPTGATLQSFSGVSCSSSTACTAVGALWDSAYQPLVERWNGTSWSAQTVRTASGTSVSLRAVSCPSGTSCFAVGTYLPSGAFGFEIAAAHWNGTTWSVQSIAGPDQPVLEGLSCPSTTACEGVGHSYIEDGGPNGAFAVRWNGATWSTQSTARTLTNTEALYGVSCGSTTTCIAVGAIGGSYSVPIRDIPLAESWNGTAWSIQSIANPKSTAPSQLNGVRCSSSSACTAVGYFFDKTGGQMTLAERWNGTSWAIQAMPDPGGGSESELADVSCPSSSLCIAVGTTGGGRSPLVERWNGTSWAIQAVPSPAGATAARLGALSCTSTGCTAVGSYDDSSWTTQPLVLRWNGTTWAVQNTPAGTYGALNGVSCSSGTACTAVGAGTGSSPLAERWNGTTWSVQTTPGGADTSLQAVSCPTATACFAVGANDISGAALAERWNGTGWTTQSLPNTADQSISCPSTASCVAVGGTDAARWNGTSWVSETTATPSTGSLRRVFCTSTFCNAVGYVHGVPLAERYG